MAKKKSSKKKKSSSKKLKPSKKKTTKKEETYKIKLPKANRATFWMISSVVLFIIVILMAATGNYQGTTGASQQDAANAAVEYINLNVLQQGITAEVDGVTETSGVYKVTLSIQDQQFESYVSKDGKLLFPQGVPIGTADLSGTG